MHCGACIQNSVNYFRVPLENTVVDALHQHGGAGQGRRSKAGAGHVAVEHRDVFALGADAGQLTVVMQAARVAPC